MDEKVYSCRCKNPVLIRLLTLKDISGTNLHCGLLKKFTAADEKIPFI